VNYREVVLVGRLTRSLARLNPGVPATVIDEAVQRVLKLDHPVLEQRNRDFHRLLRWKMSATNVSIEASP